MAPFAESEVEEAAVAWLALLGYRVRDGPELEDEQPWDEAVVLETQLREALERLNPELPRTLASTPSGSS